MIKKYKFLCVVLAFVLIISNGMITFASEPNTSSNISNINNIYQNIFLECSNREIDTLENDYDVYAYLLKNKEYLIMTSPLTFSYEMYYDLNEKEKETLNSFLKRINTLVELEALIVEDNLMFIVPDVSAAQDKPTPYALVINIMEDARLHANELKSVYDSAPFGTRTVIAGVYFTERVKSGGIWDYKNYLGVTTRYYEEELDTYMTGETIGNFHYGYVGSAVFSPTILKAAAGLAQITDGTTSLDYWNSYFDDPRDQSDIQWGIDKYNQEH